MPSYTCPSCGTRIETDKPRYQWDDYRCPVCSHTPELTGSAELARSVAHLVALDLPRRTP